MKTMIVITLVIFCVSTGNAASAISGIGVKAPGGKKLKLQKTAKSLFLVKKAKIDASIGEPQFYPIDAQLRMISNDATLHNLGKFK